METLDINLSFWREKRVFLTGHTGFKGSWLSLWLQSMGAVVTGYALPAPTHPSLFELAKVEDGMTSILRDIRSRDSLFEAMYHSSPDIVIHMAAQPLVRYSYQNPVETYEVNVMGTVNLLEAVRKTPSVRAVVNVTTDKCYENREWLWSYRESEAMGGYDPYSSSKACSELVSAAYRQSFFGKENNIYLATARAGNVIGGGDWASDRLIPDIVKGLLSGDSIFIRNPTAMRPWQHVLEPLCGYLMLAEALFSAGEPYTEAWNFGPYESDVKPVSWIVDKLVAGWTPARSWAVVTGNHPHEAKVLKLDSAKAGHLLKWKPVLRLEDALEWILRWNKNVKSGMSTREATLLDILEYQERMNHG